MKSIIIEFHKDWRTGYYKSGAYLTLSVGFMTIVFAPKSIIDQVIRISTMQTGGK